MAITQTITPLPAAPDPSMSEEDFDATATEFTAALPPLVTEINALIPQINAESAAIDADAQATAAAKNAAATSASGAATSASNAATSASGAASSASSAYTAKLAAETNAVYAKNRIDHVITQNGLTVDVNDVTQLQTALISATKLLGGANHGALACVFMGVCVVDGSGGYAQYSDFAKITKHVSFAGAGYLHFKLHGSLVDSMPKIDVRGYEYGANNYIAETASAYLYGVNGVYQQKHTNGPNATTFYYSTTQSAFILRVKINSAYYLSIRLDAMDTSTANPLQKLNIMSGMFTPLTIETI